MGDSDGDGVDTLVGKYLDQAIRKAVKSAFEERPSASHLNSIPLNEMSLTQLIQHQVETVVRSTVTTSLRSALESTMDTQVKLSIDRVFAGTGKGEKRVESIPRSYSMPPAQQAPSLLAQRSPIRPTVHISDETSTPQIVSTPVRMVGSAWVEDDLEQLSKGGPVPEGNGAPMTPRQKFAQKLISSGGAILTQMDGTDQHSPTIPTTPVNIKGEPIVDETPEKTIGMRKGSNKGFVNKVKTVPDGFHVVVPRDNDNIPKALPSPRSRFNKGKVAPSFGFSTTDALPSSSPKILPVDRTRASAGDITECKTPTRSELKGNFDFGGAPDDEVSIASAESVVKTVNKLNKRSYLEPMK